MRILRNVVLSLASALRTIGLHLGGYNQAKHVADCSPNELTIAMVRGLILGAMVIFNVGMFNYISSTLAGAYTPVGFFECAFAAILLGLVDFYVFNKMSQFQDGLHSLKDGGVRLDFLAPPPPWSKRALWARIAFGVVLCLNTAMLTGVASNEKTIVRRITAEDAIYYKDTDTRAVKEADAKQQREQLAYDTQAALVKRLAEGRPAALQAAARDARAARLNANVAVQQAAAAYDRRISTETSRLDALKQRLDTVVAARSETIRQGQDPNRISNVGLGRKLKALYWDEVSENPWLLVPLLLLFAGLLLWDLTVQTLAAIYVPRTYAAKVTREALEGLVQEARQVAANINNRPAEIAPSSPLPSPAEPEPPTPPQPVPPARRRRGRPRKNGYDPTVLAVGSSTQPAKKSVQG